MMIFSFNFLHYVILMHYQQKYPTIHWFWSKSDAHHHFKENKIFLIML